MDMDRHIGTSRCRITRFIKTAIVLMKTVRNREYVEQLDLTKALQSKCG